MTLPTYLKFTITAGLILIFSGISLVVLQSQQKQKARKEYEKMIQTQIPKVMRAVIANGVGGPDILQVKDDIPVPACDITKNQVLIKVAASAANRADLMQLKGLYPVPAGGSEIIGLEASGTIVQAPENGKWKIGDNVMCLLAGGGMAQFVTAHQDQCMPIPKKCPSLSHAAAVPEVFLTAYQCCRMSGFLTSVEETKAASKNFKRNVLIHAGASGVGTALQQIVTAFGATPVVTASKDKLDDPIIKALCPNTRFVRDNVDPAKQQQNATSADSGAEGQRPKSPSSQLPSWVSDIEKSIVGKNAIDFVVDPVVGGGYLSADIELLRTDGRVVILAMMGGSQIPKFDVAKLFRKRAHVIGSTLRSRDDQYKGELVSDFVKNVYPFLFERLTVAGVPHENEELTFAPVISKIIKMEDVVKGYSMMANNEVVGKIVMEW